MQATQATLEEGTPLSEVTFCVVDVETTGGSPATSAIAEIGALRFRGGEHLGEFHTLVDPKQPIPPFITHLTGIRNSDLVGAPPIEHVVPGLVEFLRGGVFVAHNASFDLAFVNAALVGLGYEPVPPPPVCTARLARRVIWPEVPNVKLHTLAQYFRIGRQPSHRALADAKACAEVLHALLERAGRMGILTLGDLHQAVSARGRPNFARIRLTDHLPRSPGVYCFRNKRGEVLYVGKAKDLRSRVKSYFYGDGRKKVENLLSEMHSVDATPCSSELEALVLEARLIRLHEPKYNRRGKSWRRYTYLRLDPQEPYPRIKLVREARGDALHLGPFASSTQANLAKEALEDAVPIRRCARPMRARTRFPPCALADMDRCLAPCDGRMDPDRYAELVRGLVSSLTSPGGLLGALEERMVDLASMRRFEEAARARQRLRALAEALARERMYAWILGSGRLVLEDGHGSILTLQDGALVQPGDRPEPMSSPCPRIRADELSAVRTWLSRNRVVLHDAEHPLAEPVKGGASLHRLLTRLRAAQRSLKADGRAQPIESRPWKT